VFAYIHTSYIHYTYTAPEVRLHSKQNHIISISTLPWFENTFLNMLKMRSQ